MSRTRNTADLVSLNALNAISGKVGIGTTARSNQLYVEGNAQIVGVLTATSFVGNGNVNISGISITTSSASQGAVDTFSATDFRSASYQIQITRGTEYHVTSLNIVHDGTDVYVTEFGTINTGTTLATFAADINSGNVRILATPTSATSTVFKMYRNLIKA